MSCIFSSLKCSYVYIASNEQYAYTCYQTLIAIHIMFLSALAPQQKTIPTYYIVAAAAVELVTLANL